MGVPATAPGSRVHFEITGDAASDANVSSKIALKTSLPNGPAASDPLAYGQASWFPKSGMYGTASPSRT